MSEETEVKPKKRTEAQQRADGTYRENTKDTRYVLRVAFNKDDEQDRKRFEWIEKQAVRSDAIKALIDTAMLAE